MYNSGFAGGFRGPGGTAMVNYSQMPLGPYVSGQWPTLALKLRAHSNKKPNGLVKGTVHSKYIFLPSFKAKTITVVITISASTPKHDNVLFIISMFYIYVVCCFKCSSSDWLALAAQRLWVQFPGITHTDFTHTEKCIAWMHCKSLWIKVSAKCINVNVMSFLCILFFCSCCMDSDIPLHLKRFLKLYLYHYSYCHWCEWAFTYPHHSKLYFWTNTKKMPIQFSKYVFEYLLSVFCWRSSWFIWNRWYQQ